MACVCLYLRHAFVMNKEESQKIQVDFLLADFNSIKSEIARRSVQQKSVYILYLGAISWIFTKVVSNEPYLFYIGVTWSIVVLTVMFIYKESLEITSLGEIIKSNISEELKKMTNLGGAHLIPSENVLTKYASRKRSVLDMSCNIIIFLLIPAGITLYILCTR